MSSPQLQFGIILAAPFPGGASPGQVTKDTESPPTYIYMYIYTWVRGCPAKQSGFAPRLQNHCVAQWVVGAARMHLSVV
eukprot:4977432-Lingulodinium_polyedra.AAC.1